MIEYFKKHKELLITLSAVLFVIAINFIVIFFFENDSSSIINSSKSRDLRGIDSIYKIIFNKYLKLYFGFGNISIANWILFPLLLLVYFNPNYKIKKEEIILVIFAVISGLILSALSLGNYRYPGFIMPIIVILIVYYLYQLSKLYKLGNFHFHIYKLLIFLAVFNIIYVSFFSSLTERSRRLWSDNQEIVSNLNPNMLKKIESLSDKELNSILKHYNHKLEENRNRKLVLRKQQDDLNLEKYTQKRQLKLRTKEDKTELKREILTLKLAKILKQANLDKINLNEKKSLKSESEIIIENLDAYFASIENKKNKKITNDKENKEKPILTEIQNKKSVSTKLEKSDILKLETNKKKEKKVKLDSSKFVEDTKIKIDTTDIVKLDTNRKKEKKVKLDSSKFVEDTKFKIDTTDIVKLDTNRKKEKKVKLDSSKFLEDKEIKIDTADIVKLDANRIIPSKQEERKLNIKVAKKTTKDLIVENRINTKKLQGEKGNTRKFNSEVDTFNDKVKANITIIEEDLLNNKQTSIESKSINLNISKEAENKTILETKVDTDIVEVDDNNNNDNPMYRVFETFFNFISSIFKSLFKFIEIQSGDPTKGLVHFIDSINTISHNTIYVEHLPEVVYYLPQHRFLYGNAGYYNSFDGKKTFMSHKDSLFNKVNLIITNLKFYEHFTSKRFKQHIDDNYYLIYENDKGYLVFKKNENISKVE